MNKINVGINGFGRIGRAFLKLAWKRPEIEIVAVNDLGDVENMAYLLKYDTVYRSWIADVKAETGSDPALVIEGKRVKFISEKDPANLPWKDLNIDVAVESTGFFTEYEKACVHLKAGARRVVISAPVKGEPPEGVRGATILLGLNEDRFAECEVSSNASCTTNAASPLIAILDESIGVEKAVLNTVHGYTASQALVDGPAKRGWREGRAAAENIVPSSTGAAIAVTKAFPKLNKLFDGISIRVPVPAGSIVDITFIAKRETSAEEVNDILKKAAGDPRWRGIFRATDEELVSSDILADPHASIADLTLTRVVGGNLVKVMGWYDNEYGYAHTLVEHVIKSANASR